MTISFVAPDGVQITAQQFRQALAVQHGGGSGRRLGVRSGFRVDTPSNILTASSTTWTLGPCAVEIDPGASTHQGGYGWASDANVTGAVAAADATYGRKDIVYIQVNDSSAGDGSGALSAPVLYLAGTASASPVAPTLPPRSFLVGTITVPQAGGGSPTVQRNPAVYVAAGGVLPVESATERAGLTGYDGFPVARKDVAGTPLEVHNGTGWDRQISPMVFANTALVGGAPASDAFTVGSNQPWIQGGTFIGKTDPSGYIVIGYPVPFPNFVVTPMIVNGDASVNRKAKFDLVTSPFTNDLTKFYVSVVDSTTGNPFVATETITFRFAWIAIGG